MVTTKDIARHVGVSHQAVAAALRDEAGTVRVSAATRERVRKTAQLLGYEPEQQNTARRLLGQRYGHRLLNRRIAIFFPPSFHKVAYATRIFQGVLQMTNKHEFDLVTTLVQGQKDTIFPPSVTRGEVDAAVMFSLPHHHQQLLQRFGEMKQFRDKPVVSLMHPLPLCDVVRVDEQQGAYLAAMHLLGQGHRHLMHCYGQSEKNDFHACGRTSSYKRALIEYGLDPDLHLHRVWFYWDELAGDIVEWSELLLQALRDKPQVTAIMAINDQSASALTTLLRRNGYEVPKDISVIGHDDTYPLYDEFQNNMLTTVSLPLEDIGREAVQLLLQRIGYLTPQGRRAARKSRNAKSDVVVAAAGGIEDEVIEKVLPVQFIVRGSTAPPRRN